jgi:Ca2+:H+ antiporter
MSGAGGRRMVWWWPVIAVAFFVLATLYGVGGPFRESPLGVILAVALLPVMFGTVFAAVYHSEVIAVRSGEPYGTLVMTAAVTVIEVALIISVMATGDGNATLARDSVLAVIMLVCNGLVGLCIVIGALRYLEQSFRVTGAGSYLTVLMTLAVLTLVLPNYTQSVPGPYYTTAQLAFVSVATIALYAVFLFIQTVRHRDYFILELEASKPDPTAARPSNSAVAASCLFLLLSLTMVVLLAKNFAAVLAVALATAGAPAAVAGVVVALLVLPPESIAAVAAARRNQLQKSINLALGSSLATIGLTIPAVAAVSIVLGHGLTLGLDQKDTVLLVLTFAVSLLTFATGRTHILSGLVHLVLMATFSFLVFIP